MKKVKEMLTIFGKIFLLFILVLICDIFQRLFSLGEKFSIIIQGADMANVNNIVGVIYYVVAMVSIYIIYCNYRAYHEQKRREIAMTVLRFWTKSLTKEAMAARKLADKLSDEQNKSICQMESFSIKHDKEILNYINSIFNNNQYKNNNNDPGENKNIDCETQVTQEMSIELRWLLISYLNQLEVVFSAWNNNVADQNMIEEQFRDLIVEEKGYNLIKKFRSAIGGANIYPNIERFSSEIKKQNQAKSGKTAL